MHIRRAHPIGRLATWFGAFGLGLLLHACATESEVQDALDRYYIAYDARASTFCACFHGLVGYGEIDACQSGLDLTQSEKGCIDGIFALDPDEPAREYSPAPAIDCIAEVEVGYGECLAALGCEDLKGLDDCIRERNKAIVDCPRLSTSDSKEFETCHLL